MKVSAQLVMRPTGGLEAGERHGRGEDQKADGAEVVLRDLREGDAAVFRGLEQSAALHADDGDGDVDGGHKQTAENTRADSAARHGVRARSRRGHG